MTKIDPHSRFGTRGHGLHAGATDYLNCQMIRMNANYAVREPSRRKHKKVTVVMYRDGAVRREQFASFVAFTVLLSVAVRRVARTPHPRNS
jgi:hypothetical protein